MSYHFLRAEDFEQAKLKRVNNTELRVKPNSKQGKILWLMGSGDNIRRRKYITSRIDQLDPYLRTRLEIVELNDKITPLLVPKPKTKNTKMVADGYKAKIQNRLDMKLRNASIVVVNDFAVLACLLASTTGHGNKKTLASFRGSTYVNDLFHGIPALVIEDASKCYTPDFGTLGKGESTKAQNVQWFLSDLRKMQRLFNEPNLAQDNFDERLKIVQSSYKSKEGGYRVAQPKDDGIINVNEFIAWLTRQSIMALDYETSLGWQTCLSITGIENNDITTAQTWILPCVNPLHDDNQHMPIHEYLTLHEMVLTTDCPKIWHNGNYDLIYTFKYNVVARNHQHDSMLMWHSINPRMPQSLAAVASAFSDSYYYWKDEIKGGQDEKKANTKYAVPTSRQGLLTYWRYAGLDTWHTLHSFIKMLDIYCANPEVSYNYTKELALMRGPILETNIRGVKVSRKKLTQLLDDNRDKKEKALASLRKASNGIIDKHTNTETVDWLYHTLLAPPPPKKAGRKTAYSVDQKQLTLVAEEGPILANAIRIMNKHSHYKKRDEMYSPPNQHKASGLKLRYYNREHSRLHYSYGLKPYTGRCNCTGSSLWDGLNMQNIPAEMRGFVEADDGKFLIDVDYSQADLYHFAVACNDPQMMANVFDDRDTHAVHVEMILQVPYEDVIKWKKYPEDSPEYKFVNDPIKGVRQIIKKLSHGGNYGMTPPTAYLNAGRESLDAAASILGISQKNWRRANYYDLCERLLEPYFESYPRQKKWRVELVEECVANEGYMTCFGGLTVYFDDWRRPKDHPKLMRDLLAFYGQGGTSGMINEAMLQLYYGPSKGDPTKSFLRYNNIDLLLQTHDSLTYQAPVSFLRNKKGINELLTIMELKCNYKGVEYVVPCEMNIGHRWSKSMPEIKPKHTNRDVLQLLLANYQSEGLI